MSLSGASEKNSQLKSRVDQSRRATEIYCWEDAQLFRVTTISVFLWWLQILEEVMMFIGNNTSFAEWKQIHLLCSCYWQTWFVALCQLRKVGDRRSTSPRYASSWEIIIVAVFEPDKATILFKSKNLYFQPVHSKPIHKVQNCSFEQILWLNAWSCIPCLCPFSTNFCLMTLIWSMDWTT